VAVCWYWANEACPLGCPIKLEISLFPGSAVETNFGLAVPATTRAIGRERNAASKRLSDVGFNARLVVDKAFSGTLSSAAKPLGVDDLNAKPAGV
jgi:hypothetical protein